MGNNHQIFTKGLKEKLRKLGEYMPGKPAELYILSKSLADRLDGEVTPPSFVFRAGLALDEQENLTDELKGGLIRMIPTLAELSEDKTFVSKVREIGRRMYSGIIE